MFYTLIQTFKNTEKNILGIVFYLQFETELRSYGDFSGLL